MPLTSYLITANILVSVAANPGEVTTSLSFNGVETMQALTNTVCKNAAIGTEGVLRDTRDNKTYFVTKLKDGNCWMTQNLDYDDSSSTKVATPSGWTSTSASYRAYYDPGDYVYTAPTTWTACSNNGVGLSNCTSTGWTLLSSLQPDSSWSVTYNEGFIQASSYLSTDGQTICRKEAGSWLGDMTSNYAPCRVYYYDYQQYMKHYHAGNYYTYVAATNGTGTSATTNNTNASGSICPTNWKLPTSNVTTSGSFGGLTNACSIGNNTDGANAIVSSPFYFLPGGNVNSGNLVSAGSLGYYWSSTARDGSNAYYLRFYSGGVSPSDYNNRYFGLSVRCLVQGS